MAETKTTAYPHRKRRWRRALILLGCLVAILLIPFPTEVVPEWKIRIVDAAGKPLAKQFVRQGWNHYSLESCCGGTEDSWTDENGYVVFPRRVIWASSSRRMLSPLWSEVMTLAHGSTGIHADVITWGSDNYPESVEYEPGKPLPKEIVLGR